MVEYDYVTKKRDEVQTFPKRGMGVVRFILRWLTHLQVAVFRASKGRLMNKFTGGFPVSIVTTVPAYAGMTGPAPFAASP